MDNHLILNRLRVSGTKGCDYKFHEGLNIFQGSNSSGKTTLIHLIDYLLGSSSRRFIPEVQNFCDFAFLDLTINHKKYTIRRKIPEEKGKLHLFPGHFESLTELQKTKFDIYRAGAGTIKEPSINTFFLKTLGITPRTVKLTKTTDRMATFSWRNLTYLIYVPQNGYRVIQSRCHGDQLLFKKAVFETWFDIRSETIEDLEYQKIELESDKANAEAELSSIENHTPSDLAEKGSKIKLEAIAKHISNLDGSKRSLYTNLESEGGTGPLVKELRTIRSQIGAVNEGGQELKRRLEELKILQNENELNLEKNRLLLKARKIFSELPITKCPKCFSEVNGANSHNACHVCGNDFQSVEVSKDYSRNLFLLIDEKKDLKNTIRVLKSDMENVFNEKGLFEEKKRNIESKIDVINKQIVVPLLREIEEINLKLQQLNQDLGETRQLNRILNRKNELSQQVIKVSESLIDIKDKITKTKKSADYAKEVKSNFSALFEKIISNVLHHPTKVVDYDELYVPELHEQEIFDLRMGEDIKSSQKLKVILAYYTTVLEYSLLHGTPYPKLLLFDTPRQEELDMTIFTELLTYWVDLSHHNKPYQIIITGGEFPSKEQRVLNCIIDKFHNQQESGDTSKPNRFSIRKLDSVEKQE